MYVCCAIVALLSQVCSDTATAAIFIPIVEEVAKAVQVAPWQLMVPTTLACSLPFMLPISTPPNAIALGTGFVQQADFVKTGAALLAVGLVVIPLYCVTIGSAVLGV